MEPLSIQAANLAGTRPALALGADLSAVLREGRLIAGEVLERLDGSTILVGLGRHRVPAQSAPELVPGQRFVARVEAGADGPGLRVLGGGSAAEPALLAALRGAVGSERPLGALLSELAARLRAVDGPSGAGAAGLAGRIEGHAARAGTGPAELRALLARAGQGYEALLLGGLRGRDPRAAGDLADEIAERVKRLLLADEAAPSEPAAIARVRRIGEDLGEALARALALARAAAAGRASLAATLQGALAEALESQPAEQRERLAAAAARAADGLLARPEGRSLARRALGQGGAEARARRAEQLAESALRELARSHGADARPAMPSARLAREWAPAWEAALERALAHAAHAPEEARRALLLAALERELPGLFAALPAGAGRPAPEAGASFVRALLDGPTGEALLASLGAAGSARAHAAEVASDLKGLLLAALERLPEGPAREAVARSLAGLESEQLLNLARRELGEGTHHVLPLLVGAEWRTLHVVHLPRRRGGGAADGEPLERVDLHLELPNLGPLRAELGWRAGELAVRLSCATERVAALLRAGLESLEERLASDGAQVRLVVAVVAEETLEPERSVLDVGYLREHPLLDLRG